MDTVVLALSGPSLSAPLTISLANSSGPRKHAAIIFPLPLSRLVPTFADKHRQSFGESKKGRLQPLLVRASETSGISVPSKATSDEKILQLLQTVTECFSALDSDFLKRLPSDLQVDLKDAAFDLSSKAVAMECGEAAGSALLRLGMALEAQDCAAALQAVKGLPSAVDATPPGSSSRAVLGLRLKKAGQRFSSMGAYAKGETQQIAKALIAAGSAIAEGCTASATAVGGGAPSSKVYKFGSLQVEITAPKAFVGSGIGIAFGALSWSLTSSLQNVTEDSLQYANDSALTLALSLRSTLLAAGYSCTALSLAAALGLLTLGLQLNSPSEEPPK